MEQQFYIGSNRGIGVRSHLEVLLLFFSFLLATGSHDEGTPCGRITLINLNWARRECV